MIVAFSKGPSNARRGRRSARDKVRQTLTQMRRDGLSLCEPYLRLAEMVAATNNRTLSDHNWDGRTIVKHIRGWLCENPNENDYRIALTLKEAARTSGLRRSLLYVAIGRAALRAQKCGPKTLILVSDLRQFALSVSRASPPGAVTAAMKTECQKNDAEAESMLTSHLLQYDLLHRVESSGVQASNLRATTGSKARPVASRRGGGKHRNCNPSGLISDTVGLPSGLDLGLADRRDAHRTFQNRAVVPYWLGHSRGWP
jgi:hypothetical protein